MNMNKFFIKNRKGQKISVILEQAENSKGLVFVMHGLGGFKEQDHIATFADAFKEKKYTVVRFDATNSFGESDGDYQDATVTNYFEDLEDVIKWAENQSWHQEPFVLVGHSLGAISTAIFSKKYPEKVKGLAPISLAVSGKLWKEVHDEEQMKKWEKEGIWNKGESVSKPGAMKILKWEFAKDIMKYDLLKDVTKLTMPVLLIVGEKDTATPVKHQQAFHDALNCKKELHIIAGSEHTFREKYHLQEIKKIFLDWIEKL
jgi:pimeloyl-ACP methyl ester carboxylesterase